MSAPVLASVGQPPIDIDLIRRLLALEDTHDVRGGHDSGNYPVVGEATPRGPIEEFERRLNALEVNHSNGGHDSGEYPTAEINVFSSLVDTFDARLKVLESHHDADRGHNSGSF